MECFPHGEVACGLIKKMVRRGIKAAQGGSRRQPAGACTEQELLVKTIEDRLSEIDQPVVRQDAGRSSTREERIVAAWANLAIEEPTLTLEEAVQVLSRRERTLVGS